MTFDREVMAALCLTIVWVNTGLIVAHGLGDARRLAALRRRLAGSVGRFVPASQEDGPSYRLVQAGRSRGDGAIHFHDRRTECGFEGGGRADVPAGQLDVVLGDSEGVWVWPTTAEVESRTRCTSQEEFDALARSALGARGVERVVTVKLGPSNVAGGEVVEGRLVGTASRPLIFSSDDPRSRLLGLELRVTLGLVAILVIAGALTALCFVGPAFGALAKAGAFGLFVYFLAVQPVGVWLSESVRWPHEVRRGGAWFRARLPSGAGYDLETRPASN